MVPAGAVITGRIFSQNLVSLSRRRFLSTERSGGGCFVHRFQKEEWRQKRRNTENSPCPVRSAGHRFPRRVSLLLSFPRRYERKEGSRFPGKDTVKVYPYGQFEIPAGPGCPAGRLLLIAI